MRQFIIWASGVFLLDRVTKILVSRYLVLGESIPVIKDVFHITYYRNSGAAFNVLAHKTWFFILAALVVMGFIVYYYNRTPSDRIYARTALALVFGGAWGNLVDRILWSYVIDFLDFRIWPVFNIADSAIVVGVILLSWQILTWPEEAEEG